MMSNRSKHPIHIVSFDSSKDAKNIGGQHQCQTCFEQFSTSAALRAHITAFRLEMQKLLARQLEVEAHLPLLDSEDNESDEDEDYDEDDDEDNDDYNDDKRGDHSSSNGALNGRDNAKDQARHQCPYPQCHRKKPFKTKQALVVHFQRHIRCYEICVFCRIPFSKVRSYIRHKCKSKKRQVTKSKEFYRKERCTQLRLHVNQKLDDMLTRQECILNGTEGRTPKRPLTESECSGADRTSKRHMTTMGHNILSSNPDARLITSRSNAPVLTERTAFPNYTSGSVMSSDGLYNSEISFPFSPPSFTPEGVFAPIFYGNTIPPYYPTSQSQMLHFHADTPQESYSQTVQLDGPSHGILQGLGTENQTRVGQSSDAIGRASN